MENKNVSSDGNALQLDNLSRTYTGMLDDVMFRYSNNPEGLDFFNKMIVKNIFFGGGLYLNDGYLTNNENARDLLVKENSMLRIMISHKFIHILSKASSPEGSIEMPEKMAAQKNEYYERLVDPKKNEWKDFKPHFSKVVKDATLRSWPNRDMSFGFTKLMEKAFEKTPGDLGIARHITKDEWKSIHDRFLRLDPKKSGPRDKLEKAAAEILKNRSDYNVAMNAVMTIGCQAYHYNFGLALTFEEPNGVAVDTTIGAAFEGFLEIKEVERTQLDEIELLSFPKNISFEDGRLFEAFVDPSEAIWRAKQRYLSTLQGLISSENSSDYESLGQELRDATDEYANRIIEHFPSTSKNQSSETEIEVKVYTGESGDNIAAATNSYAVLAIETSRNNNKLSQFVTERFKRRNDSDDREDQINLRDIRPQISSLAFNEKAAEEFLEDIPEAPSFK
jgi:hypothetical protein